MTTVLKILCFVFWLTTVSHTRADFSLITESDEEKEEERDFKFMDENETLLASTHSPDNFSLPKPLLEDMIDSKRQNIWWENETNFAEYDELHSHENHDSSPENSVDQDSSQNFNKLLPESSLTDSPAVDFKEESTLDSDESLLNNETTPSPVSNNSFVRPSCSFGDRKCTVMTLESSSDFSSALNKEKPTTPSMVSSSESSELIKIEDKTLTEISKISHNHSSLSKEYEISEKTTPMLTESTFSEFADFIQATTKNISELSNITNETTNISESTENITTASLENVAYESTNRTPTFTDNTSSESTENAKSVTTEIPIRNFTENITPVVTESISDHSENLIMVEGTEITKDESVIRGQLSKTDKSRQLVKQRENLSHVPNENYGRMFFKTDEETEYFVHKDSVLILNTPQFPSTLLTKLFSSESTVSDFSATKPIQSVTNTVPYVSLKSNIHEFSDSNLKKVTGDETDVELKTPLDFYAHSTSIVSTISWLDAKSSDIVFNNEKVPKEEKVSETMTVLSPSFMPLPTSSKPDALDKLKSPLLSHSQQSNVLGSSTFLKPSPVFTSAIFSSQNNEVTSIITSEKNNDEKIKAIPPPRLANPGCSSLPLCIEITLLGTSWEQFCAQRQELQEFLSQSVSHYTRPVHAYHIVLDTEVCTSAAKPPQQSPDVTAAFYVTNDAGEYEERMTEICGVILRKWAPPSFKSTVIEIRFYNSEVQATPLPIIPELNSGFVAAVSISAVAGVALCLLCILLVIMKQKLMQGRNSDTTTPTADAYSLDSLSISASFRRRRNRRSARSYLNHAFNDQDIPSHPLNEKTLGNCVKSKDLLEEEFRRIPMTMPKLDSIPEGAHVKNRYSNILPKAESRVMLADPSGDPLKCYINANYVKGYEGKPAFYIACQAPLPEGIEDFWRMVWEQQSRVIVMLTMFEENGTSRCAMYFPQSTLISQQPFGDFQISLLKKDVYEFYTVSNLRLLDLEKNLFRDVVHLWFTGWPDVGVPKDPSSLVTFVQQCRAFINCNTGPTVVHCSTGTGRTGVFLALDICVREYDQSRSIDVLQCVSQLRRDRAGSVQNKDQYLLIHEALLEYISRVNNQSRRSSVCN